MKWSKKIIGLIACLWSIQVAAQGNIKNAIDLLNQLEKQYSVNFNYLPEELKPIEIKFALPNEPEIAKVLEYISQETHLDFDNYKPNYYNVKLQKYTYCLQWIDLNTLLPIVGLNFQLNDNSYLKTNAVGKTFIHEIEKISQLQVTDFEYVLVEDVALKSGQFNCQKIYVAKVESLNEIVITDYLTEGIQIENNLGIKIEPAKMGSLAGLVQPDAFHSLQYIPGILSTTESISEINTRGGTHDENLILWNGVRMYQTGHFFGMISALNSFAPNEIKVYKNGSSAKYNEGLSAVMDIETFSKFDAENSSTLHVNMLGTSLATSQQLSNKWKLDAAMRISFTNEFISPTYRQFSDRVFQNTDLTTPTLETISTNNIDFFFQDLSFNVQHKASEKDELKFGFLGFQNQLDFDEFNTATSQSAPNLLSQDSYLAMMRWNRKWNSKWKSHVQLSGSYYLLEGFNASAVSAQSIAQKNEVLDTKLQFQNQLEVANYGQLMLGYDFQEIGVTNENRVNFPNIFQSDKKVVQIHSLYSTFAPQNLDERFQAELGLRTNYYSRINQLIVEPRINLSYAIAKHQKLLLLGEIKHQSISQIIQQQQDFFGVEQRRWSLNNTDDFQLAKSHQIEVGWQLATRSWLLQSQVYYKTVEGFNSKSQGFQNQLESVNINGSYTTFGWENLVQKKWTNLRLWANFSLSKNDYEFETFSPSIFPSNFELSFAGASGISYQYQAFSIALGSRFHTGRPFTTVDEANPIIDAGINPSIQFNSPNQANLTSYFQVNASADYTWQLAKSNVKMGASVMNIFDQRTTLNQFYELDNTATAILTRRLTNLGFTPNFFVTYLF